MTLSLKLKFRQTLRNSSTRESVFADSKPLAASQPFSPGTTAVHHPIGALFQTILAIVIGRAFGVVVLFVIGAALLAAVASLLWWRGRSRTVGPA